MASTGALKGTRGLSVYASSKHAVLGLCRTLVEEAGRDGIRVNALCPGGVDTRMMAAINAGTGAIQGVDVATARMATESGSLLGRYARAKEAAAAPRPGC